MTLLRPGYGATGFGFESPPKGRRKVQGTGRKAKTIKEKLSSYAFD
jgi:hypothetical protein